MHLQTLSCAVAALILIGCSTGTPGGSDAGAGGGGGEGGGIAGGAGGGGGVGGGLGGGTGGGGTGGGVVDSGTPDAGAPDAGTPDAGTPDAGTPDAGRTVVIAAAGDISEPSLGQQVKTSDLIVDGGYDAVLVLGDLQYNNGELANFNAYYNPTWGRFKAITYPAPGNHEYNTPNAAGYYAYFGARAGDPTKGYYSFDLGEWHIISLNSNCGDVSCSATSTQVTWLKADLLANTKKCVLAFFHHPRFNSGATHGNSTSVTPFWDALYAAKADLVLSGHEHIYERFDPQTPAGVADATNGIRSWVVGTGGRALYGLDTAEPNSAVRNASTFGILTLTLKPAGYAWKFVPIAGQTFTDMGSGVCH